MLSLSTPLELAARGLLDTNTKWRCELCNFYKNWFHIAKYNLWMGIAFPGLWVVNICLVLWVLRCVNFSCLCDSHLAGEDDWLRIMGYSLSGLSIYSFLALLVYMVVWSGV